MLLLSLLACASEVDADNFAGRYARAFCDFERSCYDAVDVVPGACEERRLDEVEGQGTQACVFDQDKAESCLDGLEQAASDCDLDDLSYVDDCAEALVCDSSCDRLYDMLYDECGFERSGQEETVSCGPDTVLACQAECGLEAGCDVFTVPDDPTSEAWLDAVERYTQCVTACG